MTQERWAEALGVSAQAVYQYEAGTISPADDIVLTMAEVSGMPVVCYWHMTRKSRVAAAILPEVPAVPLPQAVIRLLLELQELEQRGRVKELLQIAEDGVVDESERPRFEAIAEELRGLIAAALAVRLSRTDGK